MERRIPVRPEHIRALRSPNFERIKTQYAYIALEDFPTDLPLSPNPRVPNPGPIETKIRQSLQGNDGLFHILNRGITISARSAEYDNAGGVLMLDIPEDEDEYGILDGGHTYDVVRKYAGKPSQADKQFVKIEVLTSVEDHLTAIAGARNFSRQVKEFTLANHRSDLDWLKDALGDYADEVLWREGEDRDFNGMQYIQVLNAFHMRKYRNGSHPVDSYRNARKCLESAIDGSLEYLTPQVRTIARLYDLVRVEWAEQYNKANSTGKKGKFGAKKEVKSKKKRMSHHRSFPTLLDRDIPDDLPIIDRGLVMPLLAAFRVLLAEEDGELVWRTDPIRLWQAHGTSLVRRIMDASQVRNHNPQVVGRDATVYESLYDAVELLFLRGTE